MQVSRSLFQTSIRIGSQSTPTGISKAGPFLNLWSSSNDFQEQKRTMASAASFYDFKLLDSMDHNLASPSCNLEC
jgi:hypothetical protein